MVFIFSFNSNLLVVAALFWMEQAGHNNNYIAGCRHAASPQKQATEDSFSSSTVLGIII